MQSVVFRQIPMKYKSIKYEKKYNLQCVFSHNINTKQKVTEAAKQQMQNDQLKQGKQKKGTRFKAIRNLFKTLTQKSQRCQYLH